MQALFDLALSYEEQDSATAIQPYERIRALDAAHIGARINPSATWPSIAG